MKRVRLSYAERRHLAGTLVLVVLAALLLTYWTGWFWPAPLGG